MKKLTLLAVSVALIPSLAFGAFSNDLFYSSTGPETSELQEFLTDQGVYSGPITGNFYSLTQTAVKKFQQSNGITPVSGYFGPLSRAKANELLAASTPANESSATPVSDVADTNDLLAQIAQLQALLSDLQQTQNEQTAQQNQQINQQNIILGAIQKNTTPIPEPIVIIPPQVEPILKITRGNRGDIGDVGPNGETINKRPAEYYYTFEAKGDWFKIDWITMSVPGGKGQIWEMLIGEGIGRMNLTECNQYKRDQYNITDSRICPDGAAGDPAINKNPTKIFDISINENSPKNLLWSSYNGISDLVYLKATGQNTGKVIEYFKP